MPGSLVAQNISKSYAATQVLAGVSLVVASGDRVGIVGPNGIGKSTLLRVLAGLEEPDGGRVLRNGTVGYLRQENVDASRSGGEATRSALHQVMREEFDFLLLDEPTNNLDFAGLAWLERYLARTPAGVVLVSHDRAFLDRVVTRVVELEAETRRMREYAGTWTDYEQARDRAHAEHEAQYADYVDEHDRYASLLRDRREQARSLGTKQTGRRATNALRGKVSQAKHHLASLEAVDKPWSPWELRLSLPSAPVTGTIVDLRDAVADIGSFSLGPLSLTLGYGDRVAIVGRNGSGKTTLIRALLGELPLVAGSRHQGAGAVLARLDQARTDFSGTLLEEFVAASAMPEPEARTHLAKFALGADDVLRQAAALSPGERTRASLALFAARGVNCLVLDEPTNHLDLEAIEQLEAALASYEGCLVVVSHDQRFLERLAVARTIEL
ncbi:MAG TPA: ABC-F family ATP-binding cassette domain-containing protein [Gaiellaceae bacterium]|nr:ABC-F family ATP-binding cassette domain-containing protein [Gaiellaceae bacterium]